MAAIASILGNVGRVGELKTVNDTEVIDFSVASNNKRSGTTTWITCTAWAGLAARVVEPYVNTGDRVFAVGELQPVRAYAGKNGPGAEMKMRITSLELLGSGQPQDGGSQQGDGDGGELPF